MCGINGIFGSLATEDSRQRIGHMNSALAHRGPDAEGFFQNGLVALGHRRLSVIDLRESANQPMTDASGRYTLIFNGEIYNYRELRKTLGEYPFRTDGDSEVLLAGLARWGMAFVKECQGMFAFALWDATSAELYLVRDRMGIKPLYYCRTQNHTAFSSEIRALLQSGFADRRLNMARVGEYLRYQTVHGSHTLVDGVFQLPAGSILRISEDEVNMEAYWDITTQTRAEVKQLSYADTTALIQRQLRDAVKKRLRADVPMGAFLSGGIDSSALVALASQELRDPLKTFTVAFDDAAHNEASFAKSVAEKYKTDHHEINLSPKRLLEVLPDALKAMDHPGGDGINTYLIAQVAKEAGITVVLSGIGGDELFGGYPIFKQIYGLRDKGWLMSFPKFLRALAGDALQVARPGINSAKTKQVITEDYLDVENVYQYSREVASQEINKKLSSASHGGAGAVFDLLKQGIGYGTPGFKMPLLSKVSYAEMTTYMRAVLLRDADQMGMAHALEMRVPFLDHELVATVLSVKDSFKYPGTPKSLLVDSLPALLPPEIVNRPKMGFVFPWESWMKSELRDFCGDHLQQLGRRDGFHATELNHRWNAFLNGDKQVPWSRIWYLCALSAWLGRNGID